MIKEPTEEQAKILSHEGNIVVTARPGSGKTYTVVEKIRIVLEKDYVETIKKAISNKSEIKVELSETADTDNDEKKNFYNTEVNIVKSLYPAKDKEE